MKQISNNDNGAGYQTKRPAVSGLDPTLARRDLRLIGQVLSLGILAGVCLAIGIALGLWFDERWSCHPFGVVAGSCFGFIAGLVQAVQVIKESLRNRVVHNHNSNDESSTSSDAPS